MRIAAFAAAIALPPAMVPAMAPPAAAQPGAVAPVDTATAANLPLALRIERIMSSESDLLIDIAADHLIDGATAASLEDGVPVTLVYEIEVWRNRSTWFDHYEAGRLLVFKLQLDAWDEVYVLKDSEGNEQTLSDLDAVRTALARRTGVAVAPISTIAPQEHYYLIVNAALKPLTVEDMDELEGWLAGETEPEEHRFGLLTIPKAFFGFVAGLTGFGDRNQTLRTDTFQRSELAPHTAGE